MSIPKNALVSGVAYIGASRNSSIAWWDERIGLFHYERLKFGGVHTDTAPYFESNHEVPDSFAPQHACFSASKALLPLGCSIEQELKHLTVQIAKYSLTNQKLSAVRIMQAMADVRRRLLDARREPGLYTFQYPCNCGGYAWAMNGRPQSQPHMDWCPQFAEYAAWWASKQNRGESACQTSPVARRTHR